MSLPIQLALVSEGVGIDSSSLTSTAAALSKQIQRDFAPIWHVSATIDAFLKLEDVPTDYWPIIIMKDVQEAAGYHEDKNGQPFAVVQYDDQWSLTASHECLEMLADPFGRRMKAASLLQQAVHLGQKPSRVRYLVEVCDPGESAEFAYQVNGVLVSDFYTPHFFDPVKASGVRYSYTGAIESPLQVLDGGYISYEEPISQHWFQIRMFPDEISSKVPHLVDLSAQTDFLKIKATTSLRAAVDRVTKAPQYLAGLSASAVSETQQATTLAAQAQTARAQSLRKELTRLMHPKDGSG
jgi:hypothetical protein